MKWSNGSKAEKIIVVTAFVLTIGLIIYTFLSM